MKFWCTYHRARDTDLIVEGFGPSSGATAEEIISTIHAHPP